MGKNITESFITPSLEPPTYGFHSSRGNRFSFGLSQFELGFQLHATEDFLVDSISTI